LNTYANKFRTAKKKIDENEGAVSIATEALEKAEKEKKEAEKKKKDLEAQYAAVIAELKPLDGYILFIKWL
jgi:chromosome segregation ATPase